MLSLQLLCFRSSAQQRCFSIENTQLGRQAVGIFPLRVSLLASLSVGTFGELEPAKEDSVLKLANLRFRNHGSCRTIDF